MTLAEQLRALADAHGVRPVAATLARTAPPLARAVLALDTGLLSTAETRTALADVNGVALEHIPALPDVPASHREVWLRTLAAHVALGTPWTGHSPHGTLTTALIRNASDRLAAAAALVQERGQPVTYAAANWAASVAAQEWVDSEGLAHAMHVITLEEAVLTLGAASRTRLRQLADLRGRVLVLDGLHRLDPRGLRPVQALIDEHVALGLDVHLTGGQPWPLSPQPESVPDDAQRVTFVNATWLTTVEDLVQLVHQELDAHTLVLLPSRKAVLDVQARLPAGQVQARVKTSAHLKADQDSSAALHISTWSPSALTFRPYDRVITTPLPLSVLVDACDAAPQVTLLHALEFAVSTSTRTGTHLTMDLLHEGSHPQDPMVMTAYWEALLPHVQQDSLDIMGRRAELDYPRVASALSSLFQSGVQVLVDRPEATQDVARARRTGRIPVASPHTVRMTHSSLTIARERGWIEEAGEALIWTGPYANDRGVGVP